MSTIPVPNPLELTGPEQAYFNPTMPEWIRPYMVELLELTRLTDEETKKPILHLVATRERPFALQVQAVMTKTTGGPVITGSLPLPATCITFLRASFAADRFSSSTWRKLAYTPDLNDIYMAPYPEPYDLMFQYDMRSRYDGQLTLMEMQFNQRFRRASTYMTVDMGPFGIQEFIRVEITGPEDTSDLERAEPQDRALRRTYQITVMSWLVLPAVREPTIRKVTADYQDPYNGEIYGSEILAEG